MWVLSFFIIGRILLKIHLCCSSSSLFALRLGWPADFTPSATWREDFKWQHFQLSSDKIWREDFKWQNHSQHFKWILNFAWSLFGELTEYTFDLRFHSWNWTRKMAHKIWWNVSKNIWNHVFRSLLGHQGDISCKSLTAPATRQAR